MLCAQSSPVILGSVTYTCRCRAPATACTPGLASGSVTLGVHNRRRYVQNLPSATRAAVGGQQTDVVALGNLCVDVVLPVPQLPTSSSQSPERRALLRQLSSQQHDLSSWEVGGSCNFVVAAQRLGLQVTSVGHVGDDQYGRFMEQVLKEQECTHTLQRILSHGEASCSAHSTAASVHSNKDDGLAAGRHAAAQSRTTALVLQNLDDVDQTLVCFVLVDPNSNHAFCSRYDFGPWPLLGSMSRLPEQALVCLQATRAVFMNGFVFDELPLEVVRHACKHAIRHGAAVFFDPGPRCFTMMDGQRRQALEEVMDLSEVVLMTEEEAVTVTGHTDPEKAARAVLTRPSAIAKWVVVKLGAHGALLVNRTTNKTHVVPGFKVEVADTVGCGDSFAAAIVLGYLSRQPEDKVLALANAVGAATAMRRGAGRNVASASKVESILRDALPVAPEQDLIRGALDILFGSLRVRGLQAGKA